MNPLPLRRSKDLLGGLLVLALGAATALEASSYAIGSLRRMGPGFFPLCLGAILAGIGALMIATSRRPDAAAPQVRQRPEWRGWLCISASIAAFIVLGTYAGLVPATFAVVFISALGDRDNSAAAAAVLALAMTAICVVIFHWLLHLPLPLFRWI
jgi:hypothetical protein